MPGKPKTKIKQLEALQVEAEAIFIKVHGLMPEQYKKDARAATRYALAGWWNDAVLQTSAAHSAIGDLIESIADHAERNRPACAEAKVEAVEVGG